MRFPRDLFSFRLTRLSSVIFLVPLFCNATIVFPDYGKPDSATLLSCQESCSFSIVESIPIGMDYPVGSTLHNSTFSVWQELIRDATKTIEIASFYWTLRSFLPRVDQFIHGADQGEQIFNSLVEAGIDRKLTLKIVQDPPAKTRPNNDTADLKAMGAAEVRNVYFRKLFGSGILHTKLWLVDRKSAYIGSANLDWRSLTQVKEIGIYIKDCPCLAEDIGKIFDVYWMLGEPNAKRPDKWPSHLETNINEDTPLPVKIDNSDAGVFVTSSPSLLCPEGRTTDLLGVTKIISEARKYIYISVMDYYPLIIFSKKHEYWGILDTYLKTAAINYDVEIRMLISSWTSTRDYANYFLRSLADINGAFHKTKIFIKIFVVPTFGEQSRIPYARVNHNKFVVTENSAWVGTSNWSGDYFLSTGGVSFVTEGSSTLRDQLEEVFLRDWNSQFANDLSMDRPNPKDQPKIVFF
ncbi:5'-3' exonuclease PLD3-like isoform X2 [Nilaparvata lugens]|uniref:5'-3' exonuclease PLD3-like isoform X2 n=1 Tax=Nilaparvata lugens TaxID=108931 RepID=UPI00193D2D6D|nr:5'-3' exonuclease PLD3-like isoform X2 [Nilaparvata lugens]